MVQRGVKCIESCMNLSRMAADLHALEFMKNIKGNVEQSVLFIYEVDNPGENMNRKRHQFYGHCRLLSASVSRLRLNNRRR